MLPDSTGKVNIFLFRYCRRQAVKYYFEGLATDFQRQLSYSARYSAM